MAGFRRGRVTTDRVKVTMDIDTVVWEQIEDFAARIGWNSVQFVSHALGTERFLIEQEFAGASLLLVAPDQQSRLSLRIGPREIRQGNVEPG